MAALGAAGAHRGLGVGVEGDLHRHHLQRLEEAGDLLLRSLVRQPAELDEVRIGGVGRAIAGLATALEAAREARLELGLRASEDVDVAATDRLLVAAESLCLVVFGRKLHVGQARGAPVRAIHQVDATGGHDDAREEGADVVDGDVPRQAAQFDHGVALAQR